MMRRCEDIDSMWMGALDDLSAHGTKSPSRAGDMKAEVVGWCARLLNPALNFLANSRRALDPVYAAAELLWYMSREDNVAGIVPYAPQYARFAEGDGKAFGAYGRRLANNANSEDLLNYAMMRLRSDMSTRQCVVSLWNPRDLMERKNDIPCTVCWQFIVRQERLHMLVYMRSNDVWLGLPYDVFCFTSVQAMMAKELGVKLGEYVHNVGSLHLYEKNAVAAKEATHNMHWSTQTLSHDLEPAGVHKMHDAVNMERIMRSAGSVDVGWMRERLAVMGAATITSDYVRLVARRWGANEPILSPAFAKGLANGHSRRSRSGGQDDACEGDNQQAKREGVAPRVSSS